MRQRFQQPMFAALDRGLARAANQLWPLPLIRECRRILKHENGALRRLETIGTRLNLTAQDVLLADPIVERNR